MPVVQTSVSGHRGQLIKPGMPLLASVLAKLEHVGKSHSAMTPWLGERNRMIVEQLHKRGPADPEQVRCLLRRQQRLLRDDGDCLPPSQGSNYILQRGRDVTGE